MAQYFDNVELKSELRKFDVSLLGYSFSFYSDNGVFSKDKLDFGTRLLLESIDWKEVSGPILDVGCGIGPIGIIASKLTGFEVTMCDVNKRALHLCERNVRQNNAECRIIESNCYEKIAGSFNTIITNPPIRAGKAIVYGIFEGALSHLNENGCLFVVIRKQQGAESAISKIKDLFGNCDIIDKNKGYFILKATKNV